MPSERVSMYRIREVLRLSAAGLTVRQVAAQVPPLKLALEPRAGASLPSASRPPYPE